MKVSCKQALYDAAAGDSRGRQSQYHGGLRYFLSSRGRPFTRVLLIESGSRGIFDVLIPRLYARHGAANGEDVEIDLVTCYPGTPAGFSGRVYHVQDFKSSAERRRLYRELAANDYTVAGILCSNQDIMTKWKWMLATRLPAKIFIVNENADVMWLDAAHWRHLARMARVRMGLSGGSVSPAVLRILLLPFSVVFLLLYAAVVHTKRRIRTHEGHIH